MTGPLPVEVRFRGALPREVGASEAFDAATVLGARATVHFGLPCTLVVNANRQRILWWRKRGGRVEMSVHFSLIPHPDDVMRWLDGQPGAIDRLRSHLPDAGEAAPTRTRGARGTVHDLDPLLARERERWPDCPDDVFAEWGAWPSQPPRRSLRLGSCLPPRIRVHPVLDHPTVPAWFVGFIVFHEVLHVRFPPVPGPSGRRIIHTRGFRALERAHPDSARAQAFEREHVHAWLARCREHVARRARR